MKNINRYLISAAALCGVCVVLTCKNASQENNKPLLYVLKDSIDLGRIRLNDSATITWSLINKGNLPLRIISSGSSCGCSKVYLADSIIGPMDSVKLLVRYFSMDTGYFKKHIVIETNGDPIYKTLLFYGYHSGI